MVDRCDKGNVIETFPMKFLSIFSFFGFIGCILGCVFVTNPSVLKFIPLVVALIFESSLAVIVDLTKNYYSDQLLMQLYDTFDCYKHGVAMMTQFHDNKYNLSFIGMDDIQTKFNCCGVNHYEEWMESASYIPLSCCTHLDNCTLFQVKQKSGCYEAMKKDLFSNWNAMITFVMMFVFIKLIILAMYVCNAINDYHKNAEKSDASNVTAT